jgi:hypothetical protein
MKIDIDKMAARIAAVVRESLAAEEPKDEKVEDKGEKKEACERDMLSAEITALEKRLMATDIKAADEKPADEKKDEKPAEEAKKASLSDPNGVEEKITQKSLTEVEDLEHGTELATGDSVLDVAPTGYVARMKSASARLDAVAAYMEKTGRTAMAERIDRIADAIDARVASITKQS